MRVLIENKSTLAVESDDRDLLEAIKATTDGTKVRLQNRILLPVKSGPKLFSFEQYGIEYEGDAKGVIETAQFNIEKRKDNIKKIKSQYGNEIKFDYDLKGQYPAMEHQKIIFNMIAYNSAAAILAEPGTCKTGPYLWAIDKRIQRGQVKRALVITLSTLKKNVLAEMQLQTNHLKGVVLDGKAQSEKVIKKGFKDNRKNIDYDIYMANYELMHSLVDLFDDNFFDLVLLDEAHRIGSERSRQTKTIIDKFESTPYKYIVTGTLNANTSMSFFMPFRFLGPDTVPYANFYEFRRRYFFPVDPQEYIWKEIAGARHEIKQIIGNISVFFAKKECLDLPDVVFQRYGCELEGEQAKCYEEMKTNLITEIKDMCQLCNNKDSCNKSCDQAVSAKSALTVITKLQQIACGFYMNTITNIDDSGKEKLTKNIITLKENPKLRLLIETLNNIPADHKVIVWSNLVHSIDLIDEAIKKSGLGNSLLIYKDEDAFEQVERFKDPKYRYLIANPSKAAAGLNIQFSSYQVFFSCSYSLIQRIQCIGRQDRKGQKENTTVIDLCCNETIDETILEKLAAKEDLSESLVSVAKLIKLLSKK